MLADEKRQKALAIAEMLSSKLPQIAGINPNHLIFIYCNIKRNPNIFLFNFLLYTQSCIALLYFVKFICFLHLGQKRNRSEEPESSGSKKRKVYVPSSHVNGFPGSFARAQADLEARSGARFSL